ncbi:MAG: hypothetical protein Q7U74_10695, partial [Saprospiraceae bacterium]|nr:hypothetical protein [Saprospiraceae bacterium]
TPPFDYLYSTVHPEITARALLRIAPAGIKRAVLFTSTSILTKSDSEVEFERLSLRRLAEGERQFIAACDAHHIEWTVLRPTIIYSEGLDVNVTRIHNVIKRFGFFPLSGSASGLRQPVHAADLAIGAIAAAASSAAANKIYAVPGKETLSYREMTGRIFDGMGKPRRLISLPPALWRFAFICARPLIPDANPAMGTRMSKDMVFDGSAATRDFGWNPREFHPNFKSSRFT